MGSPDNEDTDMAPEAARWWPGGWYGGYDWLGWAADCDSNSDLRPGTDRPEYPALSISLHWPLWAL